MGLLALLYGLVCYLSFLGSFLSLVAFLADFGLTRPLFREPGPGGVRAVAVDLALLALFGLQHSLMARPWFKRAWHRCLPPALERSTYVLLSSLALILLFWQWRPLPGVCWQVHLPLGRGLVWGVFGFGIALVLYSTCLVSHADLFGLRQVWLAFLGKPYQERPFRSRTLYAIVRHPLMLGFLLAFWATPRMTQGHLLFAGVLTGYILLGTTLEERDLLRTLGPAYAAYRRQVPGFLPRPGRWPRRSS